MRLPFFANFMQINFTYACEETSLHSRHIKVITRYALRLSSQIASFLGFMMMMCFHGISQAFRMVFNPVRALIKYEPGNVPPTGGPRNMQCTFRRSFSFNFWWRCLFE